MLGCLVLTPLRLTTIGRLTSQPLVRRSLVTGPGLAPSPPVPQPPLHLPLGGDGVARELTKCFSRRSFILPSWIMLDLMALPFRVVLDSMHMMSLSLLKTTTTSCSSRAPGQHILVLVLVQQEDYNLNLTVDIVSSLTVCITVCGYIFSTCLAILSTVYTLYCTGCAVHKTCKCQDELMLNFSTS